MANKTEIERQLDATREQLESLQYEYQRLESSSSYRLGKLLTKAISSPRQLLSLPLDLWKLIKDIHSRRLPPSPDSATYQRLQQGWQQLASNIKIQGNPVVFIFSGTTFIQGTRGNRPIRQTQALLNLGASVLFSYHRAHYDTPLPSYQREGLVQMPQDITLQLLSEIAATDVGVSPKLFIISYPYPGIEQQIALFKKHGWGVIYDCRDDWEEFAKVGMARWYDASVEKELVKHCDKTICVSAPLVKKMKALAPSSQVELVPNAVEKDFLPVDYQHEPEEPSIIGYFGHLSEAWFDWTSFIEIAKQRPQFIFEVIGHSAPLNLELPANIKMLGPKPWHELHRYACRWKAATIPFRIGRLADGVDPIKIYEYLSFGLPVVSFRMPQIDNYPYTTTVESVSDFCIALDEAIDMTVESPKIEAFIKENTWEVRAQQLINFTLEK